MDVSVLLLLGLAGAADPTRGPAPAPPRTAAEERSLERFRLRAPLPPPAAPVAGNPLGVSAIDSARERLRLGVQPPGRRRPLVGVHYRLRLGE